MPERRLIGFIDESVVRQAPCYQPLIEERLGDEFAATFWVGEATFDLEEAETALAHAATKHGLVAGEYHWSREI